MGYQRRPPTIIICFDRSFDSFAIVIRSFKVKLQICNANFCVFFLLQFIDFNINFFPSSFLQQVSASDPDCGVNAMVNYTLGDGFKKMMEFEVKHTTGDICISGTLDFETRNSYEFPIIATDQGNVNKIATKNYFFMCKCSME